MSRKNKTPPTGANGEEPVGAEKMNSRLTRWFAHLEARGVIVPDDEDFLSFGSVWTLDRLRRDLEQYAPEQIGPLRVLVSDLYRSRRKSLATGKPHGKKCKLSIPREDLRDDWKKALATMCDERALYDAGLKLDDGPIPPVAQMTQSIEYTLRALSKVCLDAGREPDLTKATVRLLLQRQEARGLTARGLSIPLGRLAIFARYRGRKKLAKRLTALSKDYTKRARLEKKQKYIWLEQNPTTVGDVWQKAEDLLAESRAMPLRAPRRYLQALHAAVLALSVNAPLRISDLHRFRLGTEITRSSEGWSLEIGTQKTGYEYEIQQIWPEITPFLDELILLDAPGGDFWAEYDRRQGTPLFSQDRGKTGPEAIWISDVYYKHIGTGAHIIRTLWHQLAYESDAELTWMALALCGQSSSRTAREYRERNARAKTVRTGRSLLSAQRDQALAEEQMKAVTQGRDGGAVGV